MNRLIVSIFAVTLGALPCAAQSLDDLNIQIHGYATQGFLYSTHNNFFTTNSSDGSPAWTEAVVNLTSQPMPKLRVGVQARYNLLGNLGDAITLDWAAADYKANDKFGVRFGKVKIPSGLLNETQDIDPSYMWSLLPQGNYPLMSRNSTLTDYGGLAYGTLALGQTMGKLDYRGWAGEFVIPASDGYWISFKESGIALTNGLSGVRPGAALNWRTPLSGLMVGASLLRTQKSSGAFVDSYVVPGVGVTVNIPGALVLNTVNAPSYYGRFEKNRIMVAGEYSRSCGSLDLSGLAPAPQKFDTRPWYAMASYKVTDKLNAGAYLAQDINHQSALGPSRDFKDWVVSGRYDFNQFLYAKAEQHFIDGTSAGLDANMNLGGLQPTSKLTILKMGVSF